MYVESKTKGTNELIYETEIVTDVENNLMAGRGTSKGPDKLEDWYYHLHTAVYKIDK